MKQLFNILVLLLLANIAMAQAPQGIPYQAVARNSSGAILASTAISVRFTIRDSIATGAIKYQETFAVTTNALGLFNVNVGQGTVVSGTFSGINWGTNSKFMQVDMDPAGGTSYVDMGTQQMMSVPYALYAANSGGSSAGWADSAGSIYNTNTTQRVGIGTATPAARLHVADSSVVFTGFISGSLHEMTEFEFGNPPISGAGSRMMWYADKAAFRAGHVDSYSPNIWDKENVGLCSAAMGHHTTASGYASTASGAVSTASGYASTASGAGSIAMGSFSTAMGDNARAMNYGCTAMGHGTTAGYGTTAGCDFCDGSGGGGSTAMGMSTTAIGSASTAMGSFTTASGAYSTAMGDYTTASGEYSTAMGHYTTASGIYSTAMGYHTTAGYHSTAMGNLASNNDYGGSFAIGDISTFSSGVSITNDANNQMMMRFAGGYKLYTNSDATVGAQLAPGSNSWSTISDRRKKENFTTVDGEAFLKKISNFNLTSWNYMGQDPKLYRHYGPMAQDFYAAFGKDEYGTVGNDTTINQADMEGVSFIAIQALVRRTEELQKENETMKRKMELLENKNEFLGKENTELKAELSGRIEAIESELKKSKIGMK